VTVKKIGGRELITDLVDLQIVNGGQTTASILGARKKDRLTLDGVTVQMKLTEVNRDDAHDLIPKIAQYANTQNKVAIADFFANHPFHRKMEEISRRLQVPAMPGVRIQSKWFYERARGQFQNERLYLSKAKKDAFDLEYPGDQVISKTELAKYDSTWNEKPHWVSLGAQKNFTRFAGQFSGSDTDSTESEQWNTISPRYGEAYYQRIAAVAILWKKAERIVSSGRGDWYEGDYRPQIVAYALSLLFHVARTEGCEIDLGKIWTKQGIDNNLEACIRDQAIAAQKAILKPPAGTTNVGEWCKKPECWKNIQQLTNNLPDRLHQWLISKDEFNTEKAEGRKQGKQDDGIAVQGTVLALVTSGYWKSLLHWPKGDEFLTEPDRALLIKASTIEGFMNIKTEKAWKKLLEIRKKCEDEGYRQFKEDA
jgi:hypothetical protein